MQQRYSRITEEFKADLKAHLMISMQGPEANLPIFKDIILFQALNLFFQIQGFSGHARPRGDCVLVTTIQNTGFKDNKIVSSKLVTCDNIAYVFLVASSKVVLNIVV